MSIRHPDLSYLQSAIISHNALDDILRDKLAAISGLMPLCRMPGSPFLAPASQSSFICLGFNDSVSAHLLEVGDGRADLDAIGIEQQVQ